MFGKKKSVSAPEATSKKAREAKPPKVKKPFLYKNVLLVLLIGGTCAAVPAVILTHVNLTDGGDAIFNTFFGALTVILAGGTVVGMMEENRKLPGRRRPSSKAVDGDEDSPAKKKEKPAPKSKKKKEKPAPKSKKKGWFSGKKKKAKDEPTKEPQASDDDVVVEEPAEA